MMSEAEVLERVGDLSEYLTQARAELDELSDASRKISSDAAIAMHDVDSAIMELVRLSEMIEAGKISIDADSMRVLSRILDSSHDVVEDLGAYQGFHENIEDASRALAHSAIAYEDVINQSRLLNK